jgi:hypothetical protein
MKDVTEGLVFKPRVSSGSVTYQYVLRGHKKNIISVRSKVLFDFYYRTEDGVYHKANHYPSHKDSIKKMIDSGEWQFINYGNYIPVPCAGC